MARKLRKREREYVWEITRTDTGQKLIAVSDRQKEYFCSKLRRGGVWYELRKLPRGKQREDNVKD